MYVTKSSKQMQIKAETWDKFNSDSLLNYVVEGVWNYKLGETCTLIFLKFSNVIGKVQLILSSDIYLKIIIHEYKNYCTNK